MKIVLVLFIYIIILSCVCSVDWIFDKGFEFFIKKNYALGIICVLLSILFCTLHLILFDKVVLYYVKEFLL